MLIKLYVTEMPSDKLKKLRFDEEKFARAIHASTRKERTAVTYKRDIHLSRCNVREEELLALLVFRRVDASSDASRFFCKHISRFVSAHGRNALRFFSRSVSPELRN